MGIVIEPTDCNFLLAQLPDRSASQLKDWLIENYGILIRDASNFEGLTVRHFRVAAQSPEENDKLIEALKNGYPYSYTPLVIGWCLDLLFGDPACLPHPIIWFGRMIGFANVLSTGVSIACLKVDLLLLS